MSSVVSSSTVNTMVSDSAEGDILSLLTNVGIISLKYELISKLWKPLVLASVTVLTKKCQIIDISRSST